MPYLRVPIEAEVLIYIPDGDDRPIGKDDLATTTCWCSWSLKQWGAPVETTEHEFTARALKRGTC